MSHSQRQALKQRGIAIIQSFRAKTRSQGFGDGIQEGVLLLVPGGGSDPYRVTELKCEPDAKGLMQLCIEVEPVLGEQPEGKVYDFSDVTSFRTKRGDRTVNYHIPDMPRGLAAGSPTAHLYHAMHAFLSDQHIFKGGRVNTSDGSGIYRGFRVRGQEPDLNVLASVSIEHNKDPSTLEETRTFNGISWIPDRIRYDETSAQVYVRDVSAVSPDKTLEAEVDSPGRKQFRIQGQIVQVFRSL